MISSIILNVIKYWINGKYNRLKVERSRIRFPVYC